MYEVGLFLRIKGGKIVFSYRAREYEIQSHPAEPSTYICQDGEILHTLREGFETSQIEKMILRDKEYPSASGHMIGRDMLLDIFAATIDDGSKVLDFAYAEGLGKIRREKREQRLAERQGQKAESPDTTERRCPGDLKTDGVLGYGVSLGRFVFEQQNTVVYAVSDLPHIGASDVLMTYQLSKEDYRMLLAGSLPDRVPATPLVRLAAQCHRNFLCGESVYCKRYWFTLADVDMRLTDTIRPTPQFIYRGETERDFYLVFSKAHELGEYNAAAYRADTADPAEPMGVIIVAKDYDSTWISYRRFFLDWKIVIAPVAARFVKGYRDPHWKVLKDNTGVEDSGSKYVIYERPDGRIVADTCLTELDIAASREEYLQMSDEQVSAMCYASEMGRAR